MDEIFGFFPPVAEPPSKRPLLTLLKQARASGLGVVLATQNPVDLDYKGLSNAGTWLIGRLQTERDKQRLLDGLEGAAGRPASFDRAQMEQTIAGPRQARVPDEQRARGSAPVVFESRFGAVVPARAADARPDPDADGRPRRPPPHRRRRRRRRGDRPPPPPHRPRRRTARAVAPAAAAAAPAIPPDVPRYYVPRRGTAPAGASLHYVPMAIGSASARASARRAPTLTLLAPLSDGAVTLDVGRRRRRRRRPPAISARRPRATRPTATSRPRRARSAPTRRGRRTLADWLYRTQEVTVFKSARFKETSQPGESEGDFRNRLGVAAREERDAAVEKLRDKFAAKHATLAERIRKAEQAVDREAEQARGAKVQTAISLGSSILGAFLGRRKSASGATSVLRGVGRSVDQAGDTGRAKETVAALQAQDEELEREFQAATQELDRTFDPRRRSRSRRSPCGRRRPTSTCGSWRSRSRPHWLDPSGVLTAAWR